LPTDLLAFYRGGRDTEGRTLDQILAWDDVELEYVHDYIQWLFPTTRRSAFNPVAPVLTDEVISFFRRDGALRDRLLAAFDRMLRFYGFVRVKGAVERGPVLQDEDDPDEAAKRGPEYANGTVQRRSLVQV